MRLTIIILLISIHTYSQNTIGTISNSIGSYNGYTLLAPLGSTETYLINNCGQIVNQWSSTYKPAASVYLLKNGNLLRTGQITNSDVVFGGVGGKIELYGWDGTLLWEYTHSTSLVSQHHDIYPLENGNILMLAVNTMTESEAVEAGRDPLNIPDGKVYNEQILELEPFGDNEANIVWEWNFKDHLVQSIDESKDNYGVIADNPQLLDFNFTNNTSNFGRANWLHINSIQYNQELNQIILSSRNLSEIYIIEHSSTSVIAKGHTGGLYGKGGDFLYRWGNPQSYDHGTVDDNILSGQHYPHWIPDGLNDEGKVMIFNNVSSPSVSTLDIIILPETSPGIYDYDEINGYGPSLPDWRYTSPEPTDFFSAILSSGQRLPNGNTLICDGDSGYLFEIDTNENIVWEYINPISTTGTLSQGDEPITNLIFRAHKFSTDYPAFQGRDMTPGDPIELNFDISNCSTLSIDQNNISEEFNIYPIPTSDIINIRTKLKVDRIEIYDLYGKLILTSINTKDISIGNLATGIYVAKIYSDNRIGSKKIIKQ
ncbi:MAG: hypothetical protein ACJAY9_001630 [Flavobacteriales bacterium]|jgi:hypothetical protein